MSYCRYKMFGLSLLLLKSVKPEVVHDLQAKITFLSPNTIMRFLVVLAAVASVAVAAPSAAKDPYPAPCGRSDPSGICATKASCYKQGGFWVQRDCTCTWLGLV
jgi:hypothetical protein